MGGRRRTRSAGTMMLGALVAALAVGPSPMAARVPVTSGSGSADLATALGSDGTFQGTQGVSGTVDASAWTLVSDLTTNEPPRFVPATNRRASSASTGPWSALGASGSGGALNNTVWALAISGSNLYVGGSFTNAGSIAAADYVAKWNGSAWSALGSSSALNDRVYAIAIDGSNVYVGGYFTDAASIPEADHIAKWNGSTWSALGSNGSDGALDHQVSALAFVGSDLYAGGSFLDAAGILGADDVARWDGSSWHKLGSDGGALDDSVNAFAVKGSTLYVGGYFHNAGGIAEADDIATWDGSAWDAMGSDGSGNGALNLGVRSLAVMGPDIYAGGDFTNAAGVAAADYVARWNGASWSALGSNGSGNGALNSTVYDLAVSGSDLYVGGAFHNAAVTAEADSIARWNGAAWSALGSNGSGDGALDSYAWALAVGGGNLYVGGNFQNAATNTKADYVAAWALGTTVARKPDARLSLGTGAFIGNNVYNTTGMGQTKTGSAKKGKTITFGISVQNDSAAADKFKVHATGSTASGYTVKYLHGTTDITSAVVAGTFKTPSVAAAGTYLITAKVTVKSTAAAGSKVTRLVTITSVGNSAKRDAVKLTGKRS